MYISVSLPVVSFANVFSARKEKPQRENVTAMQDRKIEN